ncbi:hypothetical protein C1H46_044833 [Malus baccata]|uniref:CCHC-type domain-containing protein n=1 Tax=Malus baccata TaxID=106549 RepID=A0A540K5Z2_MALBA|nr:hypothetical protein C1H46_044833 [Malus baccata]
MGKFTGQIFFCFCCANKSIKDQLISARERITDNDLMIAVLSGLPPEFEVIKTVILARDTFISQKDFRARLMGVEAALETKMNTLAGTMSAMYMNGESSNARGPQGSFQNFEQGESSNSQRYQGGFNGGSGFAGNGGRSFQQRSGFNNNRRFNGNNNSSNSRSYSNFGNRSYGSNGLTDNKKGSQNYYSGSNNFSGENGFKQGSGWTGNTNYKSTVSPECQICSRRRHTAPNCYYRTDNGQANPRGPIFCQICGKKGHTALQCYHRNNYSYQGPPPPQTLNQSPMGLSAQTSTTM